MRKLSPGLDTVLPEKIRRRSARRVLFFGSPRFRYALLNLKRFAASGLLIPNYE